MDTPGLIVTRRNGFPEASGPAFPAFWGREPSRFRVLFQRNQVINDVQPRFKAARVKPCRRWRETKAAGAGPRRLFARRSRLFPFSPPAVPRPSPASGNGGAQPFTFPQAAGKGSSSRCRPAVSSLSATRFSGRPQEGRKRVPKGFPGLSRREGRMSAHCRGTRLMVCKKGCSVTGRLAPVPKVTHCSGAKRRTGP